MNNTSGGWAFRSDSIIPVFDLSGTPVPEPSSVVFVGAVLLLVIVLRWKPFGSHGLLPPH